MSLLESFERPIKRWGGLFNWVAVAGLVTMLCVSVIDIVAGKLFGWGLPGTIDIIGLLGTFVIAFALAQTQIRGRHVRVDFILIRLPERARGVLDSVSSFLSLALFVLLIWTSVEYAIRLRFSGESSQTLAIPFFPFVFAIALATIPLALILACEFCRSIMKVLKR
ncbi:MAG: TRAP transporter small permease [Deltaproteobacteria bacterium]|jgi:TRAP-type C4-dicarboxylate transport system permease small subunit